MPGDACVSCCYILWVCIVGGSHIWAGVGAQVCCCLDFQEGACVRG